MAYEVCTPVYEGPFDLLLHLILKEEVELWEVSLAQVIDAFLVEVDRLGPRSISRSRPSSCLIASTLVELKARRLLPGADMTELDEELLRFEERDLLLARLLECKTFKDAAAGARRAPARRQPLGAAHRRPRRAVPLDGAGPARAGHAQGAPGCGASGGSHRRSSRSSTRSTSRRSARACATRPRRCCSSLPLDRPMSFRERWSPASTTGSSSSSASSRSSSCSSRAWWTSTQIETFGDLVVRRLPDGERVLDDVSLDDWDDVPAPVG